MDLIAKLPTLAAAIYRNLYRDGKVSRCGLSVRGRVEAIGPDFSVCIAEVPTVCFNMAPLLIEITGLEWCV